MSQTTEGDDLVQKFQEDSTQLINTIRQLQRVAREQNEEYLRKNDELNILLFKLKTPAANNEAHKRIKLRVGGKKFMTTLATLTSEKDTLFSAMFSEYCNMQPNEDREYFIDRNPTHFALILDHLRGINVKKFVRDLSRRERELFIQEVHYYGIRSLYPEGKQTVASLAQSCKNGLGHILRILLKMVLGFLAIACVIGFLVNR